MELIDLTKPLVTYVGAVVILSFALLWFFIDWQGDRKHFYEQLIAVLSAIIALILTLDLRAIDFWLSLIIAVIVLIALASVMYKQETNRKKTIVGAIIAFFLTFNILLFWNDYWNNIYGVTIKAMLHSEVSSEPTTDELLSARWEQKVAGEFKRKFGATVEIFPADPHVDKRLKVIRDGLDSDSSPGKPTVTQIEDVDVFAIDVIWPKTLVKYAEDLSSSFKDLKGFFREIADNNTVDNEGERKLVAIPWFIDTGLLFYRPSLLEKHGYKEPPQTWDELEEMAKVIQREERNQEENRDFWGYVWQGAEYEGLTCNALEWQVSQNGGTIVNKSKDVDIRGSAINAFNRAKNWIWTDEISPPNITNYDEGRTLKTWLRGNAAFMRHWPYAYRASQENSSKVQGDVGVTLLPKGNGESGRHASVLGGWQLMVSARSEGKEKRAAIKFVEFLTSIDMQKSLAVETGKLPTLAKLYNDPDVRSTLKFIEEDPKLKDLFKNPSTKIIVPRPSTIAGENYPKISEAYFQRIHAILKDKSNSKNTQEVVEGLRSDIQSILR